MSILVKSAARLLWVAAGAGCAEAGPRPPLIADFAERAPPLECIAVRTAIEGQEVEDVTQSTDSTFAVLYAQERQVVVYNRRLEAVRTWQFDRSGPRGLTRPVSIALLDDSLLFVPDRAELAVKVFGPDGELRASIRTGVLPHRVALVGNQLWLSAVVMGVQSPALLYLVERDSLRPLPVPIADFPDFNVKALANFTLLSVRADGSLIVAHQYLVPRLHVRRPGGEIESHLMAVPDDAAAALSYLPRMPFTDTTVASMYVNVISAAAQGDEYMYLTRSGRTTDAGAEKALIVLDRDLRFHRAYRLPGIKAGALVWLARDHTVLLADEEGNWFSCTVGTQAW